jgi:hypothetical protein
MQRSNEPGQKHPCLERSLGPGEYQAGHLTCRSGLLRVGKDIY